MRGLIVITLGSHCIFTIIIMLESHHEILYIGFITNGMTTVIINI